MTPQNVLWLMRWDEWRKWVEKNPNMPCWRAAKQAVNRKRNLWVIYI